MNCNMVSAVMFTRDQRSIAAFYKAVLGATVEADGAEYTVLSCAGFEFVVHQIPRDLLSPATAGEPIQRRERSALRLNFPIVDLSRARREAGRLGGGIDDEPPPWAGGDTTFYLGQDPEGNVFGLNVLA